MRAPNVTGTGTGAGLGGDAWRYNNANTALDDTSSAGNVTVTYTGPVSAINLFFYSQNAGGEHRVFLGDFTFTALCT